MTAIKEKVFELEAGLQMIKKALRKEPNFDVDEKNWLKIEREAKNLRTNLYRKVYGKR